MMTHKKDKLTVFFETQLTSICGNQNEEGECELKFVNIIIKNQKQTLPLEALFLSIGILPNTQLFPTLAKRKNETLKISNINKLLILECLQRIVQIMNLGKL